MANFPGLILTDAGRNLQAKAQIGQQLNFSRVALGDGLMPANPEALTELVNEKQSLSIQAFEVLGDGTSKIRAILTNEGLATGFFVREIGVFAQDPDTLEEKLYSYANSGSQSDFLPAQGGATIVEQIFDLITVIGTANNVTAVIDDYITIATKADVDELRPYVLPPAGLPGHMLRKASNAEGDAEWFDPADGLDVRVTSVEEVRVAVEDQQTFSLAKTTTSGLAVYVDGLRLSESDWTILGATQLRLNNPLSGGETVVFVQNEEAGSLSVPRVSLVGPNLVFVGQSYTFTITDYDGFATYSVTASGGATVTRAADELTVTLPAEFTDSFLDISIARDGAGATYAIAVEQQTIQRPQIVAPIDGADDVSIVPILSSSAFGTYPAGVDTLDHIQWQIATDADFESIVHDSGTTAPSDLSYDLEEAGVTLTFSTSYYLRVRHVGVGLGASDWSPVVTFTTSANGVGQRVSGGIIAGQKDGYWLIVPPASEWSFQEWGEDVDTPAVNLTTQLVPDPNDGVYNTDVTLGSSDAAAFCRQFTFEGKDDYFLPNREEALVLYANRAAVDAADDSGSAYSLAYIASRTGLAGISDPASSSNDAAQGLDSPTVQTSTEYSDITNWGVDFSTGNPVFLNKTVSSVWCIPMRRIPI